MKIEIRMQLTVAAAAMLAVRLWSAEPAMGATNAPISEYTRRMLEAGFTPENCWLKGKFMCGKDVLKRINVLPRDVCHYDWGFEDGSLCGIIQSNELTDVRVEVGVLKFRTSGTNAFFAWGNMDPVRPPLKIGEPVFGRNMTELQARMRQSLPLSLWSAVVQVTNAPVRCLAPVPVSGTNWNTVTFRFRLGFLLGKPRVIDGIRLETVTSNNQVEIDWVRPSRSEWQQLYRKTLDLPAAVRWAKCSLAARGPHQLYVNGRPAISPPPKSFNISLYDYELDPGLFRAGENVIAVEHEYPVGVYFWGVLVDGALVCADGTYARLDSDATWKFKELGKDEPVYAGWFNIKYDDSEWGAVDVTTYAQPDQMLSRRLDRIQFFNPSWKGRMQVAPADGRSQPIFGSREEVALKIAIPAKTGEQHQVRYQVFDEMGDGFHAADKLVKEGNLELQRSEVSGQGSENQKSEIRNPKSPDYVGTLRFSAGELPYNRAYAVVFHLKVNGEEVEKYRYEIAVCGPLDQPVVEGPKDYTDGMDLKLVWETDAAAEQQAGEFVAADGKGVEKETEVIRTPLGRFRICPGGMYMSFKYVIRHPGRPHAAIAAYPDDTHRVQEMRLTEQFPEIPPGTSYTIYQNQLGNHTVALGIENPLTHTLGQHTVVFFPNESTGTVSIFNTKISGLRSDEKGNYDVSRDTAARAGKIRIYEIMNDIPMRKMNDAPGAPKWIGQQSEAGPRQIMQSCFASPIAIPFRNSLLLANTPNFYRNWLATYINLIKRLRFAGNNCYVSGQIQYDGVFYPSVFSVEGQIGTDGSRRDTGVLLSRMLEENNMGWFAGIEMINLRDYSAKARYTDEEVAKGADTIGQVGKDGRQLRWHEPILNWIRPQGRGHFERAFNELIGLYGKEKGWKGVFLQVNELLGPCWADPTGSDPYFASYDDYTISLFEKETGIKIPEAGKQTTDDGRRTTDKPKDPGRFGKRYEWLMANTEAKKQWTDWRCRKTNEIYDWLKQQLKAARPDLDLVFYPQAGSYMVPPAYEKPADPLPSIYDYARRGGMDLERIKNDPDMILLMNCQANGDLINMAWNKGGYSPKNRFMARTARYLMPFADDGKNGVAVRFNWMEPDVHGPKGWIWSYSETESWPCGAGDFIADYFVNLFLRTNPTMVITPLTDYVLWMGRETRMSKFAKAFRSIPAGRYTRLTGEECDPNIWLATAPHADAIYGYIANPQWWNMDAQIRFPPGATVTDLMEEKPVKRSPWKLRMGPYDLRTFRMNHAGSEPPVLSCVAEVSREGQALTRKHLEQAETFVQSLKDTPPEEQGEVDETAVRSMIEKAKVFLKAGDYAQAYDELTISAGANEILKSKVEYCTGELLRRAGNLAHQGKKKPACSYYRRVLEAPDAADEERATAQWLGAGLFAEAAGGTTAEIAARRAEEMKKALAMTNAPATIVGDVSRVLVDYYVSVNKDSAALAYYDRLAARPDLGGFFGMASIDISAMYRARKQYEKSLESLKNGLAAKGNSPQTSACLLYELGQTYALLNESEKAQNAFIEVCAQYPDTAYTHTLQSAFEKLDSDMIGREKYRNVLRIMAERIPENDRTAALLQRIREKLKLLE